MGGISLRDTAGLVLGMLIIAFFNWPKTAIMGIWQRLFEAADSGRHSRMKELRRRNGRPYVLLITYTLR